jgi:hypothetical protein
MFGNSTLRAISYTLVFPSRFVKGFLGKYRGLGQTDINNFIYN